MERVLAFSSEDGLDTAATLPVVCADGSLGFVAAAGGLAGGAVFGQRVPSALDAVVDGFDFMGDVDVDDSESSTGSSASTSSAAASHGGVVDGGTAAAATGRGKQPSWVGEPFGGWSQPRSPPIAAAAATTAAAEAEAEEGDASSLGNVIVVVGGCGQNFERHSSAEYFSEREDTWHPLPNLSTPRAFCAAVTLDGIVYVSGGHNGYHSLRTTESYSSTTNTWTPRAAMNRARTTHRAFAHKGLIYVVGGEEAETKPHSGDSIEVYSVEEDSWTVLPMRFARRVHPAYALHQNWIYISGGLATVIPGYPSKCFDRINLDTFEHQALPAMYDQRCVHTMLALKNVMYVIGGHNGDGPLSDIGTFNIDLLDGQPASKARPVEWKESAKKMLRNRPMAMAEVLSDTKILIAGGVDTMSFKLVSTEIFDLETGTSVYGKNMVNPRGGAGITMIADPGDLPKITAAQKEAYIKRNTELAQMEIRNGEAERSGNCSKDARCTKHNRHTGRCKTSSSLPASSTRKGKPKKTGKNTKSGSKRHRGHNMSSANNVADVSCGRLGASALSAPTRALANGLAAATDPL